MWSKGCTSVSVLFCLRYCYSAHYAWPSSSIRSFGRSKGLIPWFLFVDAGCCNDVVLCSVLLCMTWSDVGSSGIRICAIYPEPGNSSDYHAGAVTVDSGEEHIGGVGIRLTGTAHVRLFPFLVFSYGYYNLFFAWDISAHWTSHISRFRQWPTMWQQSSLQNGQLDCLLLLSVSMPAGKSAERSSTGMICV